MLDIIPPSGLHRVLRCVKEPVEQRFFWGCRRQEFSSAEPVSRQARV